ncbi:unnamed protein product, partial [Ectocarpus fasciculatus]
MKRENKLRAMKERQFDEKSLHQLFRLFDRDNDRRLTLADFQAGLVAMGYEEAKDMTLVDRIVKEIDMDRSGDITEDEFVEYFTRRRLEDLEQRLTEASKEDTLSTVRVTQYGVLEPEYIDSGVLDLKQDSENAALKDLLKQSPTEVQSWSTLPRRWFDVNGFQQATISLFGQRFGLHEETMKDAGLFQRQKIEVLTPGAAANWVLDDDAVAQPVAENPLMMGVQRNNSHPNLGDANIDEQPLIPPKQARAVSMPSVRRNVSMERTRSLSVSGAPREHCLAIVHALFVSPPLSECVWDSDGKLQSTPDPSLVKDQYAIFSFGDDAVLTVRKDYADIYPVTKADEDSDSSSAEREDLMCELRERIKRGDADLRINSSSGKYLAFSAMEMIMEKNYRIHDDLRRWLSKLEAEIRSKPVPSHTYHLYELGKLATSYSAELSAFVECLEGAIRDHGTPLELTTPLASFFKNEFIFFKDLSDEIRTISAEVDEILSTVQRLGEFYRSAQDDRMNQILHILTLVTSVFVPAQFLTGLYGMNFEYMPELGWRYSYPLFWVVVIISTLCVTLLIR